MANLLKILNSQHAINVFQDACSYVIGHQEEWLYDPSRQFVRNVKDGLSFETTFKAPFQFSSESIECFGETSPTPFLESTFCKKRQYIKPDAYKFVFDKVTNSNRTPLTFHGKRILAGDGSDQGVYGTAAYDRIRRMRNLMETLESMADNKTHDKDSLIALARQAKHLYKRCRISTEGVKKEISRIQKLEETTEEDLLQLIEKISDLNMEAKKKQEPFLITYKNGDTRYAVHINLLYDALTRIFLDFTLQPGAQINEDAALIELIHRTKLDPAECIITLDRGYESLYSFYLLDQADFLFVCRIKDVTSSRTFLKELNLPFDVEFSRVITIRLLPDHKAAKQRAEGFTGLIKTIKGPEVEDIFRGREYVDLTIRIVRFQVVSPDGSVSWQMVATNLDSEEFSTEDIKHIYRCRWQLEEGINHFKNKLNIKKLHGRKLDTIQQELFAQMTVYNLSSINKNEIEEQEKLGRWSVAEDETAEEQEESGQQSVPEDETAEEQEEPGQQSVPEDETVEDPEAFHFTYIPRLEYHSAADPDDTADSVSSCVNFQKLEVLTAEEIDKADKEAKEYSKTLGIPGVLNEDININLNLLTPQNGNKLVYGLNFTVTTALVKRYMFDPAPNTAEKIHKRARAHKVPIILNKPDTRNKYRKRSVQKASGDYHHSESRIDVKPKA